MNIFFHLIIIFSTHLKFIINLVKGDDYIEIKIVGYNTLEGMALERNVIKVVENLDSKVTISLINSYNFDKLPILYINNKLVSEGRVVSERQIIKILKKL